MTNEELLKALQRLDDRLVGMDHNYQKDCMIVRYMMDRINLIENAQYEILEAIRTTNNKLQRYIRESKKKNDQ